MLAIDTSYINNNINAHNITKNEDVNNKNIENEYEENKDYKNFDTYTKCDEQKAPGIYSVNADDSISFEPYSDEDDNKYAESKNVNSLENNNDNREDSKTICDTGKVDREIKKLKAKMEELGKQILMTQKQGDESKIKNLESKLNAVKAELAQKDNDSYRKNNATYTNIK